MRKEIDILLHAAAKGCVVVEKGTNLVWELDDLVTAETARLFEEEKDLLAPDRMEVTSAYPGCAHAAAAPLRAIGQTPHFAIFSTQ